MRLGSDCGYAFAALAGLYCTSPVRIVDPRADAHAARVQPRICGCKNRAEGWRAVLYKSDVDGVIVTSADEFLSPIERIYEKIDIFMRGDSAGRDFFLGNDRNSRCGASKRRIRERRGS